MAARGTWAGAGAPTAGAGAAPGPPVGPPGGSVGSLMVGAAEGLGGKLMRTVSFLGWTLPVSFFGGTAPPGVLGMLSAIKLILIQPRVEAEMCQLIIGFRIDACPAAKLNHAFSSINSRRSTPCGRR